jgi:hypothetical protein
METCGCCCKASQDVFDGLCENCETVFDEQLQLLSKSIPHTTPLPQLFKMALENAKLVQAANEK